MLTSLMGGGGHSLIHVVLSPAGIQDASLASTPCSCTQILGFALRLAMPPNLPITPQSVKHHNLPFGLTGFLLLVIINTLTRDITQHFL